MTEDTRDGQGEGTPAISRVGDEIGPYRLLEPLGEGGMGTVYLAEQTEPVRRRVAIKLIRSTLTRSDARVRFEAERHALARLQHQNVAQLYEAGTTRDGHPYFVMEYVDGPRITHYCDERRLSLEERLELFRQVCAGVTHAHQKGLLHRDLKPSNILVAEVEGRPVPKIIDFGIAKALDQPLVDATLLTERVMGTPAYLAPEAIDVGDDGPVDVDTRTDVYSLGVLLYELLVGVRPFDAEGVRAFQVMMRIVGQDPSGPSTRWTGLEVGTRQALAERRKLEATELPRRLRGDLDWIVLKAIAKKRDERYGSPAELAADIGRHLENLPVVAGPPSTLYRVAKFVRRRRGLVAAVGLLVTTLAAGVVARSLEAERANREADTARRALAESEALSRFLVELFEVSDPGVARGEEVTARELLDRGADKIRFEFGEQPLAQARFMQTMGEVYQRLGLYDRARSLVEESLSIRQAHLSPDDPEVASSLHSLGHIEWREAHYEAAAATLEEAVELRERVLGADHRDLAESLNILGLVYWDEGRFEEAEGLFRRAMAIQERGGGLERELAGSLTSLGILYWGKGRYDEAEPLFLRALEIREAVLGSDHPEVAGTLDNLGNLHAVQGHYAEAEPIFRRALEIETRVLGRDHPQIAYTLTSLGTLEASQGHYAEAEPLLREALSVWEKAHGLDHPNVAFCLNNLGSIYQKLGRPEEAEPLLERAIEIREAALGRDHPHVAWPLAALGSVYRDEGRYEEAEAVLRRALAIRETAFGSDHPDIAGVLASLGGLYRDVGRYDEAEPLLERAVAIQRRLPDHPALPQVVGEYTTLLRATGREDEAVSLERELFPDPS